MTHDASTPTHAYQSQGTFRVELQVEDDRGQIDFDTIEITILSHQVPATTPAAHEELAASGCLGVAVGVESVDDDNCTSVSKYQISTSPSRMRCTSRIDAESGWAPS